MIDSQARNDLIKRNVLVLSVAFGILGCLCATLYALNSKGFSENQSSQILRQASTNETLSEEDKQWVETEKAFTFKCSHSLVNKHFQPSIINKPGDKHPLPPANIESNMQPSIEHRAEQNKNTNINSQGIQGDDIYLKKKLNPFHKTNARNQENHSRQKKYQYAEMSQKQLQQQQQQQQDPFRISLDYSNANLSSFQEKSVYIQTVLLPEIITKLQSFLSIKRTNAKIPSPKILIPYSQCFRTKVPLPHSTIGIDTDFIAYITNSESSDAFSQQSTASTLFWGVACVRDYSSNYRPVAAQLNINANLLDINNHSFNEKALLHEILHVLGFSSENLIYGPGGEKRVLFRKGLRNPAKRYVNLEEVTNYAATYFNCTDKSASSFFEGIQIEDEEIDPTDEDSFHFEKLLMMNDIMTNEIMPNSMISPITLKVLEATGWYDINFDVSMPFHYLLCAGCHALDQLNPQEHPKPLSSQNQVEQQEQLKNRHLHFLGKINQGFQQKAFEVMDSGDLVWGQSSPPNPIQNMLNKYDNGSQNFCDEVSFNQKGRGCSYDFKFKSVCHPSKSSNGMSYLRPIQGASCLLLPQAGVTNGVNQNTTNTGEVFSNSSYCFISNVSSSKVINPTLPNPPKRIQQIYDRNSNNNNNNVNVKNNHQLIELETREYRSDSGEVGNNNNKDISGNSARCYMAECNSAQTEISIHIFNSTAICKSDYEMISSPQDFEGVLLCPHIQSFCLAYTLRNYHPNAHSV